MRLICVSTFSSDLLPREHHIAQFDLQDPSESPLDRAHFTNEELQVKFFGGFSLKPLPCQAA